MPEKCEVVYYHRAETPIFAGRAQGSCRED
jgi:hypothetical protein